MVGAATLTVPAGAAWAATTLTATLTCDAVAGTVTASAYADSGPVSRPLTINFLRAGGSYVTASTMSSLPYESTPTSVPVTTDGTGAWSAIGYTRTWIGQDYLFYRENVRVAVVDPTLGREIQNQVVSCVHDARSTFSFDCDAQAHTANIHAAGAQYNGVTLAVVSYYRRSAASQATPDSPIFRTTFPLNDPPVRTAIAWVTSDGTWSDPGYSYTGSNHYYSETRWRIDVTTAWGASTLLIGQGEGSCVTADQRPQDGAAV